MLLLILLEKLELKVPVFKKESDHSQHVSTNSRKKELFRKKGYPFSVGNDIFTFCLMLDVAEQLCDCLTKLDSEEGLDIS